MGLSPGAVERLPLLGPSVPGTMQGDTMGWFRVYFNVGWCSMDVQAEEREEAITKVWETLNDLRHGAVEGFRLGRLIALRIHTLSGMRNVRRRIWQLRIFCVCQATERGSERL